MKIINRKWIASGMVAMTLLASGCQTKVAMPDTVESHYMAAEKLVIMASYEEALTQYDAAMVCLQTGDAAQTANVSKGILNFNIGYCYEQIGDYEHAIEYYTASGQDQESAMLARVALGGVYFKMKNYEASKACYEEAIDLEADAYEAYVNLSAVYSLEENDEYALFLLTKAIDIDGDKPDAYVNRAYIYACLGNEKEMNADIQKLRNMNFAGLDVYVKIFNDTLQEVER
ncbi:MAG: hypothetical protein JXO44_12475 [Clostridia bacterium]|nr:hypothetical protein [Clostridia bacterium]